MCNCDKSWLALISPSKWLSQQQMTELLGNMHYRGMEGTVLLKAWLRLLLETTTTTNRHFRVQLCRFLLFILQLARSFWGFYFCCSIWSELPTYRAPLEWQGKPQGIGGKKRQKEISVQQKPTENWKSVQVSRLAAHKADRWSCWGITTTTIPNNGSLFKSWIFTGCVSLKSI